MKKTQDKFPKFIWGNLRVTGLPIRVYGSPKVAVVNGELIVDNPVAELLAPAAPYAVCGGRVCLVVGIDADGDIDPVNCVWVSEAGADYALHTGRFTMTVPKEILMDETFLCSAAKAMLMPTWEYEMLGGDYLTDLEGWS